MNTPNIQYIPTHTCPECSAEAITNAGGDWFTSWMILGSRSCAPDQWKDHIAYVKFNCDCHKYGSMRVARLGDAIIPLEFVSIEEAREMERRLDVINAKCTTHAVQYLTEHASGTRVEYLTQYTKKIRLLGRFQQSMKYSDTIPKASLDGGTALENHTPIQEDVKGQRVTTGR